MACAPGLNVTRYFAEVPAEPNQRLYSFEYPAGWALHNMKEEIWLASDPDIFEDFPEAFQPGQILASVRVTAGAAPDEMIASFLPSGESLLEVGDTVRYEVDGLPAAYAEAVQTETGEHFLIIARDLGWDLGGLIAARLAPGGLESNKETLLKIAESLRIEP
jgi:hypothetical protein